MADLKKTWTQTAKSFVIAFNDLGVSLADSVISPWIGLKKIILTYRTPTPSIPKASRSPKRSLLQNPLHPHQKQQNKPTTAKKPPSIPESGFLVHHTGLFDFFRRLSDHCAGI